MDAVHQPVLLPHLLIGALDRHADRTVLHLADGTTLTGAQTAAETSRMVQALGALGVDRSARVALLSGNRVEVLHVMHATQLMATLFTPLHPLGSVEDFLHVVEDAGIDTIVFDPGFSATVAQIRARAPQVRRFLCLGPNGRDVDLNAVCAEQAPAPLGCVELAGDEVFRLTYSGGTTGRPKAIESDYASATRMHEIMMAEWEWPGEVRQLLCAPLSHTGGVLFLPTLMNGGTMYVIPGFDPGVVLAAVERHRITCMLLVPTMIYALLDHPEVATRDLSSIETIIYGASPMLASRLREGIGRLGPVFFQFYGQAEAPMTITTLRRADHDVSSDRRLASCGRPVPWVHLALLDAGGRPVADGEPGEICVRGSLVMRGYRNRPELNEDVFRHGWLHTGDIAIKDPDGFYRMVDRSKDMIITGGFNVYPREVEDALGQHAAVAAAGVFGLPDDRWGEMVAAAVVLRRGASATAEELCAHVRALKGPHQSPKRIVFVDELPLTPVGKPDKKALRAGFSERLGPA